MCVCVCVCVCVLAAKAGGGICCEEEEEEEEEKGFILTHGGGMKSESWYLLKIIKDTGAVGRSVLLIVEGYNGAIATYRVPFDADRATPPPPPYR